VLYIEVWGLNEKYSDELRQRSMRDWRRW